MSYFATTTVLKKFASILLIVILFFNWYGYRIVTNMKITEADQQLETRLDNNDYDESQLIEVKVALNLPYQTNQSEFERHYGEIEIDGQLYSYVKRKIQDGFLILKCIPNDSKQKIKAADTDFFKMANGLDQQQPDKKQSSNNNLAKNFWSEYDGRESDYTLSISSDYISKEFASLAYSLNSIAQKTPAQPPEA